MAEQRCISAMTHNPPTSKPASSCLLSLETSKTVQTAMELRPSLSRGQSSPKQQETSASQQFQICRMCEQQPVKQLPLIRPDSDEPEDRLQLNYDV